MKARFWHELNNDTVQCVLCPHECVIAPGKRGRCHARENREGVLIALTYAQIASTAMDPIEKKPLYHFHPGRDILSLGTWGCNFHCAFCQNHSISQHEVPTRELQPDAAVDLAGRQNSIGIAYTYNEPLIMMEYLLDCGAAVREAGLKNVVVTNGFVNPEPLAELLPLIDAMNIDIKAFHPEFYSELCGGSLEAVLNVAAQAAEQCHVEITTLLIPEHNDAPKELENEAAWIAENLGPDTPLHLSAYFPRYKMNVAPTSETLLLHAREIFMEKLNYVYLGNVHTVDGNDTRCPACDAVIVARDGYATDIRGMNGDGTCAACGATAGIIAA